MIICNANGCILVSNDGPVKCNLKYKLALTNIKSDPGGPEKNRFSWIQFSKTFLLLAKK